MSNVAILGASDKPDRYAHKAQQLLMEHGHRVFPVTPVAGQILGVPTLPSLAAITEPLDTVTLYVNPKRLAPLLPELLAARPRRVIFNPGTESAEHRATLTAAGIACEEACTLVLLRTGQF